jgi:hypothetical protein
VQLVDEVQLTLSKAYVSVVETFVHLVPLKVKEFPALSTAIHQTELMHDTLVRIRSKPGSASTRLHVEEPVYSRA